MTTDIKTVTLSHPHLDRAVQIGVILTGVIITYAVTLTGIIVLARLLTHH